jgi:DtxR family Mn-dependent transcriptional regulator
MYLVSLALLAEKGVPCPIPVPRLAEELEIQTVSANQMVRKLEEAGLVEYQPYKGVSLTLEGEKVVNLILRNRRLWEVFFVKKLGFSSARADELACRMEHITVDEVADRLSSYLDHPTVSPTGKVIPLADTEKSIIRGFPLTTLQPGQRGVIHEILAEPQTSTYLQSEGMVPGVVVRLLAASSSGSFLLNLENKKITLTTEIAEQIMLTKTES